MLAHVIRSQRVSTPLLLASALTVAGAAGAAAQEHREPDAGKRARQLVTSFELPQQVRAAVRELVGLGPAALPALHVALRDPRPEIVQWALFASAGLAGDCESLREPVRLLATSSNASVAAAAAHALAALDGRGSTLIVEYDSAHAVEIDAAGEWHELAKQPMLMDAARLSDGHLLVTSYRGNCVLELDAQGGEVWSQRGLQEPSAAQRLPGGNTLIADSSALRVIEVDRKGTIVWQYAEHVRPIRVARLGNGNTLICSYQASGLVEVDRDGKVVWRMPGQDIRDVERLPDDTTLVTRTDEKRVVLVDRGLRVLQEWKFAFEPRAAELLPDGHLLVGGNGHLVEVDDGGVEVWSEKVGIINTVARHGRREPPPAAKPEAGK